MRRVLLFCALCLVALPVFGSGSIEARELCGRGGVVCHDGRTRAKVAEFERAYAEVRSTGRRQLLSLIRDVRLRDLKSCRMDMDTVACTIGKLDAMTREVRACFGTANGKPDLPTCPFYAHGRCPWFIGAASPYLASMPGYLARAKARDVGLVAGFDCADALTRTPDELTLPVEGESNAIVLARRDGYVAVDEWARGAKGGNEALTVYSVQGDKIAFHDAFPALKPGSPGYIALFRKDEVLRPGPLSPSLCCEALGRNPLAIDRMLRGRGIRELPLPDGWSFTDRGSVVVGFADEGGVGGRLMATVEIGGERLSQYAAPRYRALLVEHAR